MKVLITGGTGFLGYHLHLQQPKNIKATSIHNPADNQVKPSWIQSRAIDLNNHSAIKKTLNQLQPNAIIHTAGQSSVDWCEENQDTAYELNVNASRNLAHYCQANNAHFIYISSNAVYGGTKPLNKESDLPAPKNFYGQTKLLVEQYLSQQRHPYTVIRPNLMFGWTPPGGHDNQVTRTIQALTQKKPINVVNDTYFSPISGDLCASAIWQILIHGKNGIFNVGSPNRLSLFNLSKLTAQVFNLDANLIKPISHQDTSSNAPRAVDTSFNISRLTSLLNFIPPGIPQQLQAMKKQAIRQSVTPSTQTNQ